MKKNIVIILLLLIVIIQFTVSLSMAAENGIDDPLVTLSYIEKRFVEFKEYVDYKISDSGSSNGKFEVLNIKAGNKVIFTSESTEFILRAGEASAIVSVNGGLANLTTGIDLKKDENVQLNSLILIPRDDGRGVLANTDIWIMIKGQYEIR
ncbi:hypothetical protein QUF55_03735 [Clostridiaceae bacterium HSG29]|nr:hypothetical protein [Clostridiaceae bacterium HSG29]